APPLDRRTLRADDGGLARKMVRAGGFSLFHQRRNRAPGFASLLRIDAVKPEHNRGIEHAAGIVADLEGRAGPSREIAVAGTIDEDIRTDRLPPGLGLDDKRVDAPIVMHRHAGSERVNEDIYVVAHAQ